jgi:hypothetical protein
MAGEIGLGTLLLFDLDGQRVASSAFLNIPHRPACLESPVPGGDRSRPNP